MTLTDEPSEVRTAEAGGEPGAVARPLVATAALAAVVVGIAAGAIVRQGGFYPRDAFGIAMVSLPLAGIALWRGRDRPGLLVAVALGALALWWFVRAQRTGSGATFLPLGASILGFGAAFLVVRLLDDRDRQWVATAVVGIGALSGAAGVAGTFLRWQPYAQRTGGLWHEVTTLTYPGGAALLSVVALTVAMAFEVRARPVRLAVCLCVAGLVASRSPWELLALAAAATVVPWRRWTAALWPIATGTLAGAATLNASSGARAPWASAAVAAGAVAASLLRREAHETPGILGRTVGAAGLVVVAAAAVVLLVRPPGIPTLRQPADQSQTLAWSSASSAWRSSPVTGVGPPRMSVARPAVDVEPGFAPDAYLTVLADGGLLGAALLVSAGAAVASAVGRRDLLASCAMGGILAFAVAGVVDFGWLLPALAVIGGVTAGLAATRPAVHELAGSEESSSGVTQRRALVPSLLVLAVVAVVAVQLLIGTADQAASVPTVRNLAPPHSRTPYAPARMILRGPDPTDPFMVRVDGRDYLYASQGTSFRNVPLWIGRPGHWGAAIDALPSLPSWAAPGLTWAPDVQRVAGGWALYFTSLLRGVEPPTHCIGAAFSRSPTGPFVATQSPFICQLDHRGSIDARVFVDTGHRLVMLWKSEDNANPSVPGPDQNGPTGVYAQDLRQDGRRLLGSPVKIFGPTQPWEGTIVEAPDMVEAWGTYWLFFSGNWYDSTLYGIGVAACQSPFGPCADTDPRPFLGSNLQGLGPGESSLFHDGPDVYLLYNPFRANDPGPVIPRPVAMVRLGFTPSGPYLATP